MHDVELEVRCDLMAVCRDIFRQPASQPDQTDRETDRVQDSHTATEIARTGSRDNDSQGRQEPGQEPAVSRFSESRSLRASDWQRMGRDVV